jgi:hypoxanthine phosphoribosyltransferase
MNHSPQLQVLLSRKEIEVAVSKLAAEIRQDYLGKSPLVVAVLKGSFVFLADLIRRLDLPLKVDFVRLSSYGCNTESAGKISIMYGVSMPVAGADVLVVEDIIDSGLTTGFLLDYLRKEKPASLRLCALTNKPARRRTGVHIDYLGFTVPDKFLVGYGLDWNENFRHLPDICTLEWGEDA